MVDTNPLSYATLTAKPSDIFGCLPDQYIGVATACSSVFEAIPPCATNTPEDKFDAGCCTSLSAYGSSIESCFSVQAPSCYNPGAVSSFFSELGTTTDVCDQYFTTTSMGSVTMSGGDTVSTTGARSTGSGTATGSAATATKTSAGVKFGASGKWRLLGLLGGTMALGIMAM